MIRPHRKTILAAILSASALTAAGSAHAGGFGIHEQSAEFLGMAFAGAAAGGSGLSSMFWNPATITDHRGWKEEWNASLVIPHSRARNEAGGLGGTSDSGNIGKTAFVPASYDSYQVNEMFWVGLAMTSPFGMMTKNDPASRGAFYGYKSKIFTMNINPMVGVKLNDMISLGFGLQVNYMKGNLSNAQSGIQFAKVKGDDWGIGFNAGLTLKPTETTTIGIGYRSRIKHKLLSSEREVTAAKLGEWVMEELRGLDQIAYIRFASVYLSFDDMDAFRETIERLERDLSPEARKHQISFLDSE